MANGQTIGEGLAHIEPAAAACGDMPGPEAACLLSIAISMKRIAEALAPIAGEDVGVTLWKIEQRLGPQS